MVMLIRVPLARGDAYFRGANPPRPVAGKLNRVGGVEDGVRGRALKTAAQGPGRTRERQEEQADYTILAVVARFR